MMQYFEGLALEHDPRGYCVCTSEGKDSRVLGHLFRRAGVKHFYLHSITGIDPPELVYFQRRNFQKYRDAGYLTYDVMYRYSMWALILKKLILPMRQMRFCCEYLKEPKTHEQCEAIVSLGVRKSESTKRATLRDELELFNRKEKNSIIMPYDNDEKRRDFEVCYADREKRLNPIAHWSTEDIWNYSLEAHLEQCVLYQEGFDRLGCIGCPQAGECGRRKQFTRWPKFASLYLLAIARLLEVRKAEGRKTPFHDPVEYFEWWLSDKSQDKPIDKDQIDLFDESIA